MADLKHPPAFIAYGLTTAADFERAGDIANSFAEALDQPRERAHQDEANNIGTLALAAVLTARGLLTVQAMQIADDTRQPMPNVWAGLLHMLQNPPAEFEAQLSVKNLDTGEIRDEH